MRIRTALRTIRRPPLRIGVLVLMALAVSAPVRAQEPALLQEAERLVEAGRYEDAAELVRRHLRDHPDDGGSRWLLGRLLHWTGEEDAARAEYETAISLLPDDPWLRIEYSDVLVALGEHDRARSVLEEVLRMDPENRAARTRIREIRALTSPWLRIGGEALDDNQPYRRYRGTVEVGTWLSRSWSVAVGARPHLLEARTGESGGEGWAHLAGFLPGARLRLSARGGAAWQPGVRGREVEWLGGADVSLGLSGDVSLRAGGSRERYLWTRASADTLLMTTALDLRLEHAEASGWAGEAVVRLEDFRDGNTIRTAYVWLLAPVLPALRLGYSFAWQDADETRWSADPAAGAPGLPGGAPTPPTAAADTVPGRYDPYFTPEQIRIHALLAEVRGDLGRGVGRLNLSWGVHATEQAPILLASAGGGGARLVFAERDFTPWEVAGTLDLEVSGGVDLRFEAEHRRTAFYELSRVGLSTVYRFGRTTAAAAR